MVSSGLMPLDYFLTLLRDENNESHVRIDAAKAAAPYVHPRLASTELTGKDGKPLMPPTDEDRAKALAEFIARTMKL